MRRQWPERTVVRAAARVLRWRRMETRTSSWSALSRSSPAAAAESTSPEESLARVAALSLPPPPFSIETGSREQSRVAGLAAKGRGRHGYRVGLCLFLPRHLI